MIKGKWNISLIRVTLHDNIIKRTLLHGILHIVCYYCQIALFKKCITGSIFHFSISISLNWEPYNTRCNIIQVIVPLPPIMGKSQTNSCQGVASCCTLSSLFPLVFQSLLCILLCYTSIRGPQSNEVRGVRHSKFARPLAYSSNIAFLKQSDTNLNSPPPPLLFYFIWHHGLKQQLLYSSFMRRANLE